MNRLINKKTVITGGTSGIGLATAIQFANEGAQVIITGTHEQRLKDALAKIGGNAKGFLSEAGSLQDIRNLASRVKDLFGQVDVLFVNAGLGFFAPIEQVDEQHFDQQFNVNVKGLFFTVQQFLPLLKKGSSVILTSSVVPEMGMPGGAVYSATKGAVLSLNKVFAAELISKGIRVNTVSPGPINTNFFARNGLTPEQIEGFASGILQQLPIGRFGEPEEIAKAVAFLASDDSSYVVGENLIIDGGMVNL